jgi:hypothetical protein
LDGDREKEEKELLSGGNSEVNENIPEGKEENLDELKEEVGYNLKEYKKETSPDEECYEDIDKEGEM